MEGPVDLLRDWATTTPVVVVDLLPVKLWRHTAVGRTGLSRAAAAGLPNTRLTFALPRRWRLERRPTVGLVPFPVVGLHARAFEDWGAARRRRSTFRHRGPPPLSDGGPARRRTGDATDLTDEGRVRSFAQLATPSALRLATLAAVSPATTIAVLRAIQEEMLPGSGVSDLAEVVVSGLFEHVSSGAGDVRLRLRPGCRDELKKTAGHLDGWSVHRAITRSVERHFPALSSTNFQAAVLDPSGAQLLPAELAPFAEVAVNALRSRRFDARPATPPLPATPSPEEPAVDADDRTVFALLVAVDDYPPPIRPLYRLSQRHGRTAAIPREPSGSDSSRRGCLSTPMQHERT